MDDFEILKNSMLTVGIESEWKEIEKIKDPRWRAIERQNFFEVIKTLPIELEKPNIIDMIAFVNTL